MGRRASGPRGHQLLLLSAEVVLRRGLPVFVRQTTGLRLVEDRGRGLDAEHRPILARRLPERAALAIFAGTDADRDQDGAGSGGHPADDVGYRIGTVKFVAVAA